MLLDYKKQLDPALKKERAIQERKKNLSGWLFVLPYVIAFVVFIVIPLGWGIITSFMRYNPYDPTKNGFYSDFFLNYKRVFGLDPAYRAYSREFWRALLITMAFDAVAVPCLIFVPLALAYFVNQKPPGYKIFRAIIYVPSVISVATMGAIFVLLFSEDSVGFINSLFGIKVAWLSGLERWFVILLASVWWQSGQNFVIFSAALRDVDKSLYEASEVDGASKFQQFVSITLPAIRNQMIVCLFTTIIGYMSLYAQPSVINSPINKNDVVTPIMQIQINIKSPDHWGQIGYFTATSFVFAMILMIMSGIQMQATKERKGGNKYATKFAAYMSTDR